VPHAFAAALRLTHTQASRLRSDTRIIAEIKRASPSKGVINDRIDVAEVARDYAAGGAAAISVLTEEDFFKGSLDDLRFVKAAVDLPVLRKDFTIEEYQIYEAAAAGADAILLIVTALDEDELLRLRTLAEDELGMDAIVEVHSAEELEIADRIGAKMIGVNNRNLNTFDVSLDVSRELIKHRPEGVLMIAESGLTTRAEIDELRSLGFDGFLIGEALMRQPHVLASLAGGVA
jgi:indole-3-glycerol phosphate synthase